MNMDIESVNVDGSMANMIKIMDHIYTSFPLLVLIQDPPAVSTDLTRIINLLGYTIIDPISNHDDNMIIVRQDVLLTRTATHQTDLSLGSHVIISNTRYLVISIYIRPRTTFNVLERCLNQLGQDIRSSGQSMAIVAVDTNATDPDWAPQHETAPELCSTEHSMVQAGEGHYRQTKRTRGRQLSSFFRSLKMTCLNDPNDICLSFRGNGGRTSHIDVVYAGSRVIRKWESLRTPNSMTPHPLIIIEYIGPSHQFDIITRHRLDTLTSRHFSALELEFQPLKTNVEQLELNNLKGRIEKMTSIIIKHMLNAQDAVCVERRVHPTSTRPQARSRMKILKLTKSLEKSEKMIRVLKRTTEGAARVRLTKHKQRRARLRAKIFRIMRMDLLPQDCINSRDLWTRTNTIIESIAPTHNTNMSIQLLEQIATEKFAPFNTNIPDANDIFPDDFRPNDVISLDQRLTNARSTRINNQSNYRPPHNRHALLISINETIEALKMVKNKRFTGPEGLKYETLIKASQSITPILHTWCHTCFRAAYTPLQCKITHGVIIPKKQQGKFRIVHVGSPLTSLLERIALSRLEFQLERIDLPSNKQFGFTANVDRHDLITRVLELIIKNSLCSPEGESHSIVISFDIKGAFDNVDQNLLRQKLMTQLTPDPIRVWLANFVHNRKIILKHNELRARPRRITKGVPQGSILGPVLWNFMINDIDQSISETNCRTELLAYADDLILIYLGKDYSHLQEQVDKLNHQVKSLNLEIEPEKCSITRIRWSRLRNHANNDLSLTPNITINEQLVNKTSSVSILGVPVTHQLKLNLDDYRNKLNLRDSASMLNLIKRHNIVKNSSDWRILIDSYITNTLIINNMPLLAIDKTARAWCDKTMD